MRCFVAIDIPEEICVRIAELQELLRRAEADVRWVPRASLHLTLRFLGDAEEAAASRLAGALEAEAARRPPLRLSVEGSGLFPRVVWAGCAGDLGPLAAAVDGIATAHGFPREPLPFVPHITIGRVKSARHEARLRAALPAGALGAFDATELVLVRSTLRPEGPLYERIAAFPFRSGR